MNFLKCVATSALVITLAACGGGGGSAGTASNGSGNQTSVGPGGTLPPSTVPVDVSTLTLKLVNSNGAPTSSVSAAGLVSAKATLKDMNGILVTGTKVSFVGDSALIKISPATSVLTDSAGVATVQLSAASLGATGAGTLNATAMLGGATLTSNVDFQLSPAKLTLVELDVGSGTLAAYGNRAVSVIAKIDGQIATNTPVQVNFSAACGTVKPSIATTDSKGKAVSTYTADSANCAGTNVKITANSLGVSLPLEGTIAVEPVQATNLQFVKASPALIYLLGSGATTQSLVTFKVVDSTGNAVQNQKINLALLNAAPAAGLSIDALGNSNSVEKTSDATGQVTVAVFSGNVPTSVQVTASLVAPSNVSTNSNILTVASGKPVQRAASLAIERFSIEGFNVDGATSNVTFSMADRQGNPVPDGTEVNMVAESGVLIPARCVVAGGASQCSSTYRSSGTRPLNGRVSILAFVPGEEDFIDENFNNQYDLGESFIDMGDAYRDDDENSVFTVGEFSVPRAASAICSGGENGRSNTCDGLWGANEVRKQAVIIVATSTAIIAPLSTSRTDFRVSVTDENGNSMPTGTTIAAAKQSGNASCTVTSVVPAVVANRFGAQVVSIDLDQCNPRIDAVAASNGPPPVAAVPEIPADSIRITVTSPGGITTVRTIALTSTP